MKFFTSLLFCLLGMALSAQTSWTPIQVGTTSKLNCISFGTNQVGYIGGEDSTLLKTVDGGKTWTDIGLNISTNIGTPTVTDIQFLTAKYGFMLVNNFLFKTINGGINWVSEQPNNTNMCFKTGLYFFDIANGFVGGSMCFQGATISQLNASNWDSTYVVGGWDASEQITNFDFLNTLVGLASSTGNYFFRTTDGGISWDTIATSLDTVPISDVLYMNDTLVYATYETMGMEGVLISKDGGLSWKRFNDIATFAYPGLSCAIKTKHNKPFFGGWGYTGPSGMIFEKTPNWWSYATVAQRINGMATHSDSIVFAVGDSGFVVVNVLPENIGIPENSLLSVQAYPNPFVDEVTIMGLTGHTEIRILDSTGRLLSNQRTSEKMVKIKTQELNPGVYFFNVLASNLSKTFKLVK